MGTGGPYCYALNHHGSTYPEIGTGRSKCLKGQPNHYQFCGPPILTGKVRRVSDLQGPSAAVKVPSKVVVNPSLRSQRAVKQAENQ